MSAETKTCSSCGAPVIFAKHERTEKFAPLEPDPEGRFTIVHPHYFFASPNLAPEHRYSSHFASCPGAAGHRADSSSSSSDPSPKQEVLL